MIITFDEGYHYPTTILNSVTSQGTTNFGKELLRKEVALKLIFIHSR